MYIISLSFSYIISKMGITIPSPHGYCEKGNKKYKALSTGCQMAGTVKGRLLLLVIQKSNRPIHYLISYPLVAISLLNRYQLWQRYPSIQRYVLLPMVQLLGSSCPSEATFSSLSPLAFRGSHDYFLAIISRRELCVSLLDQCG